MSRTARLSLLALLTVLTPSVLTACSGEEADDRAARTVLVDAADASLDSRRFTVDLEARLDIEGRELGLTAEGRVDYDAVVADLSLGVEQEQGTTVAQILSDGERVWVSLEGDQAPALPGGARYVQGDADLLAEATTFAPDSLLGVLHVLRGADDVEQGGEEDVDGVDARLFTFTVPYLDAVEAAGDDADAFEAAFNLTGEATGADLAVEVAVGRDDVVRRFSLEVVGGELEVSGTYDLTLGAIGEDVVAPDAPPRREVASRADSAEPLEQLLT